MRVCSKCKVEKLYEEFYSDKNRPLGISYLCKPCSKVKSRNNEIRAAYGIDQAQYEELLVEQEHKCAICNRSDTGIDRTKRLSIDHCHTTGEVRGLLCNWCNQGLGMFSDNPELLAKAIGYLKKE